MPKSKAKRKKSGGQPHTGEKIAWGGKPAGGSRQMNIVLAAVALAAVAAVAIYLFTSIHGERTFLALAEEGRGRLSAVVSETDLGRRHLDPGESHSYGESFPTSGPHEQTWLPPGFYEEAQRPTQIVHSLEHGNVVIYFDQPGEEALAMMKDWTGLYGGQWDGLVAMRTAGLERAVVLTAWTKELRMEDFDPAVAAAFIDEYRGRGPENPVR
jgi:hypothetical protein